MNSSNPPVTSITGLNDTFRRLFYVYISKDGTRNFRIRMEILPQKASSKCSLLGFHEPRDADDWARKHHRFLHALNGELKKFQRNLG